MNDWIELRPNDWTYELECPDCGFIYSPDSYEDGTVDTLYNFCPICGRRLYEWFDWD